MSRIISIHANKKLMDLKRPILSTMSPMSPVDQAKIRLVCLPGYTTSAQMTA